MASEDNDDGLLSPVPEFSITHHDRNEPEKRLPEFDEQDYQSHRNVYVAVHVPYVVPRQRKHHHHHRRRRKRINVQQEHSSGHHTPLMEEVDHLEVPSQFDAPPQTPSDPCDRVKFILGESCQDGEETSHHVFTELEELCYSEHGENLEWKETARWVKFEEDIEEGGEKWSKPHVASLSLHSLFDLRNCMLKGTVLLDVVGNNLEMISDIVVDHLVLTKQLEEENRDKVRAALLQRHRHHCTKDADKKMFPSILNFGDMVHHGSQSKKMDSGDHNNNHSQNSILSWLARQTSDDPTGTSNGKKKVSTVSDNSVHQSTTGDDPPAKFDQHFMKKLPPGSEASNVLVGEVDFLKHSIIAFVRLSQSQLLGDLTEVPVPTRFLFILLGPKGNQERYHEIGRAIATLMADEVFHEVAYKARNREDLLAGVDEFLDKVTVLPPGEWDPDIRLEPPPQIPSQAERRVHAKDAGDKETEIPPSVECTKLPLKGLIGDIKRRYRHYVTDFRDAFWDTSKNRCSVLALLTTIASIIFIYFANIAPAITFGQVLSEKTGGYMGAVEMIISAAIGNFVYSLTAGQPLVVLGGTGPTLIFEDILYRFSTSRNIPYLEFRLWIGLWTALFIILMVVFNVSVIVRIFTRFTVEIFSALISFIFIYEAFEKIWKIHLVNPYNGYYFFPFWSRKCDCYEYNNIFSYNDTTSSLINATNLGSYWDKNTNSVFLESCDENNLRRWVGPDCPGIIKPDVFFFSVILFFGTFAVAYYLKKFKETPFFSTWVRKIISDFAVMISVIIWIAVNYFANVKDVPTLQVPDILGEGDLYSNNTVRKSFLLEPLGNNLPHWAPIAAVIPALLATGLLFMDQQITALVVNRKDNKLKKGSGYHLDLLIVGCLIGVFSLLGLPWVVGATVRSIAHVQSLFLFSPCTAPGERPKFLGVKEQRVTLLCMSILLGLSILMYQVLQLIPLAVLYGLFLFIGVASLSGIQFVDRILIIFMPDKYKPDEEYVRHIPNRRLHLFTLVQIILLCLLCIFKVVSQISIIFPVMVLLLVLGRWLVGWCFPKRDLEILDEPIPEKLYCRRQCCGKPCPHGDVEVDVEKGIEETDFDPVTNVGLNDNSVETEINMTREVNRCDLWKHMVHSLDKEPHNIQNTKDDSKKNGNVRKNLSSQFEDEMNKHLDTEPVLNSYKSTQV